MACLAGSETPSNHTARLIAMLDALVQPIASLEDKENQSELLKLVHIESDDLIDYYQ